MNSTVKEVCNACGATNIASFDGISVGATYVVTIPFCDACITEEEEAQAMKDWMLKVITNLVERQ